MASWLRSSAPATRMTNSAPAEGSGVLLVRPGVGGQRFSLSPGSTVGDLLRVAGAERSNQDVMMGSRKLEESDVLEPDSIVFLVPRPGNALVELVEDEVLGPAGLTEGELR